MTGSGTWTKKKTRTLTLTSTLTLLILTLTPHPPYLTLLISPLTPHPLTDPRTGRKKIFPPHCDWDWNMEQKEKEGFFDGLLLAFYPTIWVVAASVLNGTGVSLTLNPNP